MKAFLTAFALGLTAYGCSDAPSAPIALDPVVVRSPLLLPGAIVQGASSKWFMTYAPPRYGDPVPVQMTAYCLTRAEWCCG